MVARLGNVLYWLGVGVAVICLVVAVLVALGAFPDLPSALGYLKPTEKLVVEMSFPRSDGDTDPPTNTVEINATMPPRELEEGLIKVAAELCKRHEGKDCWKQTGGLIVWEAHPLGKLPTNPATIVSEYGFNVVGTNEERAWKADYENAGVIIPH